MRLCRKRRMLPALFPDSKSEDKNKHPVKTWSPHTNLVEKHTGIKQNDSAKAVQRPKNTGIPGVSKIIKLVRGKKYVFWQATWHLKPGVLTKKAFSVGRHGDAKAKKLALLARKAGLTKMI